MAIGLANVQSLIPLQSEVLKDVRTDVQDLKSSSKEVRTDVQVLKSTSNVVRTDVQSLKSTTEMMSKTISELQTQMKTMYTSHEAAVIIKKVIYVCLG